MPRVKSVDAPEYPCSFVDCDETRTEYSTVAGSFCSTECHRRHEGRALLRDIRQDHRFCWSCFRQRKDVERPTDDFLRGRGRHTAEAIIGYEYLSEHATRGPYGPECKCGGIDHDVPPDGGRDRVAWHWYLALASMQLQADGRRDDRLDPATLADEYWQTDDLELAVGRALDA